jgi:hypothetical protein
MNKYTYSDLIKIARKNGANLAEVAIGRMMDEVYEETGKWPSWNEEAPEWIIKEVIG